jgi:uncharacterized protein
MKRLIVSLVALLLIAGLTLTGCSSPAPSPAAPAPASSPSAPAATQSAAPQHAPYEIELPSGKFGGFAYINGTGLADVINKNSKWLKATNLEVPGGIENIKKDYDSAEKKAHSVRVASGTVFWNAIAGAAPFTQKYSPKSIFTFNVPINYFATMDASIKKIEDLAGKKVMVGGRGSSQMSDVMFILQDCYSVWDKVDQQYLDFTSAKDNFMDGLLPAIIGSGGWEGGSKFSLRPDMIEIVRVKGDKVYFVGQTAESVAAGAKKRGWPVAALKIPAKSLTETLPVTDMYTFAGQLGWFAYPEVPEDVVYEICRVVYENRDTFGKLDSSFKMMSDPQGLAFMAAANESEVHPGALKFYKEKSLKLFIGGESPVK